VTASVATGGSIVAAGVSSVAAKVAGASAGVVCSGAAFSVRLATPSGGGLGGRIVWCFSTSRFEISCSICALNSFEARLNSLSALPIWRAISGNFLGPNTTRANKNRKIVSEKLMRFIILPEPEKRQSLRVELIFQQLAPERSFTWSAQSHSPITQTLNQLEQDLKSGTISGPQQDFAQIRQASQNPGIAKSRAITITITAVMKAAETRSVNCVGERIGSARKPSNSLATTQALNPIHGENRNVAVKMLPRRHSVLPTGGGTREGITNRDCDAGR
jgi:hypothetical protein